MDTDVRVETFSELSQTSKMIFFFSRQKIVQVSGYFIEIPKEKIATSAAVETFKPESKCETLSVIVQLVTLTFSSNFFEALISKSRIDY